MGNELSGLSGGREREAREWSLEQVMVSRKRIARMLRTSGTLPGNMLQAALQGRAPELGGAQYEAAGVPEPRARAVRYAQGPSSPNLSQHHSKQ